MKLTACLSLIVAVLVSVSTAEALTDRDRLEKLAQQNGVGSPSESTFDALIKVAKTVCVCHDPTLSTLVGVLTQSQGPNDVSIFCTVPSFSKGGDVTNLSNCVTYSVIAR